MNDAKRYLLTIPDDLDRRLKGAFLEGTRATIIRNLLLALLKEVEKPGGEVLISLAQKGRIRIVPE